MKGDPFTRPDQADLRIVFRTKDLLAHYKKTRTLYQKWADKTCSSPVPTSGGDHTLNIPETVEQLTVLIRNFDEELKYIFVKKTQDEIGMTHDRVCRLFAMNIVSGELVKPPN